MNDTVIEGLKVKLSGHQVTLLLSQRRDSAMTKLRVFDKIGKLDPDSVSEYRVKALNEFIDRVTFLIDHIEPNDTYLLSGTEFPKR